MLAVGVFIVGVEEWEDSDPNVFLRWKTYALYLYWTSSY